MGTGRHDDRHVVGGWALLAGLVRAVAVVVAGEFTEDWWTQTPKVTPNGEHHRRDSPIAQTGATTRTTS